jgi:hypothetical protein
MNPVQSAHTYIDRVLTRPGQSPIAARSSPQGRSHALARCVGRCCGAVTAHGGSGGGCASGTARYRWPRRRAAAGGLALPQGARGSVCARHLTDTQLHSLHKSPSAVTISPQSNPRLGPPRSRPWNAAQVSRPTVIRFGPNDYRMWAYGREANFSALYHHFSFGRSGHFVSSDGGRGRVARTGSRALVRARSRAVEASARRARRAAVAACTATRRDRGPAATRPPARVAQRRATPQSSVGRPRPPSPTDAPAAPPLPPSRRRPLGAGRRRRRAGQRVGPAGGHGPVRRRRRRHLGRVLPQGDVLRTR